MDTSDCQYNIDNHRKPFFYITYTGEVPTAAALELIKAMAACGMEIFELNEAQAMPEDGQCFILDHHPFPEARLMSAPEAPAPDANPGEAKAGH